MRCKEVEQIQQIQQYINEAVFRDALSIPTQADIQILPLAQGEYNINYMFIHPTTKKKLVLRVNTGSQMHLSNQIEYEYRALEELAGCGRTPTPFYVDGSRSQLPYGVLVMEFLEGRALDYKTDLCLAAQCLADIHSVDIKQPDFFIRPQKPMQSILTECREMAAHYVESSLGDVAVKHQMNRMLDKGERMVLASGEQSDYNCCVNTELNSGNFLMNGAGNPNYLVDWEKPIIGDMAQDLGHFLAPTTTFWKTDVILDQSEINIFMAEYERKARLRMNVGNLRERTQQYLRMTCLRGITWCAMAWVAYQDPDKLISNPVTAKKLNIYLQKEFLDEIERRSLGASS